MNVKLSSMELFLNSQKILETADYTIAQSYLVCKYSAVVGSSGSMGRKYKKGLTIHNLFRGVTRNLRAK